MSSVVQTVEMDIDPTVVVSFICYNEAARWTAHDVEQFYKLPVEDRFGIEPICKSITHYRRIGKFANFAFLCTLKSPVPSLTKVKSFWLPYLSVMGSPSCRRALQDKVFNMKDVLNVYSDGEDAWTSASEDDGSHTYRKLQGKCHFLKRKRLDIKSM